MAESAYFFSPLKMSLMRRRRLSMDLDEQFLFHD
jgi:hypothetical protein